MENLYIHEIRNSYKPLSLASVHEILGYIAKYDGFVKFMIDLNSIAFLSAVEYMADDADEGKIDYYNVGIHWHTNIGSIETSEYKFFISKESAAELYTLGSLHLDSLAEYVKWK